MRVVAEGSKLIKGLRISDTYRFCKRTLKINRSPYEDDNEGLLAQHAASNDGACFVLLRIIIKRYSIKGLLRDKMHVALSPAFL